MISYAVEDLGKLLRLIGHSFDLNGMKELTSN